MWLLMGVWILVGLDGIGGRVGVDMVDMGVGGGGGGVGGGDDDDD